MKKISIVGAGRVGESTAPTLAKAERCREIALIDIVVGVPQGTALDIQESAPVFGFDTRLTGHNNLDAMAQSDLIIITAGLPRNPRMASFVAMETGLSVQDITAMVLGGHGDTMVPLPRYTCINGIPITQLLNKEQIERIVKRTREGGAEILALRKTSSAYDAPAAAVATMVDAIRHDRNRILPCVAILDDEYGQKGICMGVPVFVSSCGMA